ncbi:hypothetical protein [Thiomicrorhabdus sp. 6S3-12]|uniref:hypothetical protein n=1 Tax=Thiomicrorhabdus sp. 6S3-12 TaxID=2819681 RepID=UPI001AADDC18|nr:hypothetical protein [Thiomicrorhabdus sp. 6S3-12]MBO1924369.1 hypothetical protein [Thiomicrorhabdus sp. 6S3-12]
MDISLFLKWATDLLLLKNPKGTSLGVIFGFLAHELFSKFYKDYFTIQFNILLGVFIFNLIPYFKNNGRELSREAEEKLDFIEVAVKRGGLSSAQAKLLYIEAVQDFIKEKTEKLDEPKKE